MMWLTFFKRVMIAIVFPHNEKDRDYALRPGEAHLCRFLLVSPVLTLFRLFPMYYLFAGVFADHFPILCRSVKTRTSLSHPWQDPQIETPPPSTSLWLSHVPQDSPAHRLSRQTG